jgi:hypothetical protein
MERSRGEFIVDEEHYFYSTSLKDALRFAIRYASDLQSCRVDRVTEVSSKTFCMTFLHPVRVVTIYFRRDTTEFTCDGDLMRLQSIAEPITDLSVCHLCWTLAALLRMNRDSIPKRYQYKFADQK